jgi:cytochrome c-type biogenesis protein CcmH
MISFIISAVVLVLMAVVFIVPTLLKKNYSFSDEYDDLNVSIAKDRLKEIKLQLDAGEINQETYQQLHDELESTLALDLSSTSQALSKTVKENTKLTAIVLAMAIPVISAAIYYQLGDFSAATGIRVAATVIPAGENRPQMTIEEAVDRLEQRLAVDPENPEGWYMLAKTYMAMSQYHKAATSYKKVLNIMGDEPEVLLRYADALAMTEDGKLNGVAKPVVEKLIALIPDNPTVLWMAGSAQNQQGNYSKALSYWYKLHPLLSQDVNGQGQLEVLIKGAEGQLPAAKVTALRQQVKAPASPAKAQSAGSVAEIIVTVELDPSLRDKVSTTDTLFIFAKAMQGPPMPLAAVKKTVAALPITVSLTDAMAMMPQMKLSNFEQVKISAVISKSGQPGTQVGDLYAEVSPVSVKSQEKISLIINQVK